MAPSLTHPSIRVEYVTCQTGISSQAQDACSRYAISLVADTSTSIKIMYSASLLRNMQISQSKHVGLLYLESLSAWLQCFACTKHAASYMQVLQHAPKAWGQRRDTDHTLSDSQTNEILRLISTADCWLAASMHCNSHCQIQYAKAAPHLIGKHTVCLLHFLQQVQSRLEIRVLHIALDQCTVAPHIQGHTCTVAIAMSGATCVD